MTYVTSQGCTCNNLSLINTKLGCFTPTLNPSVVSSSYSQQLKYLITGCATFKDYLSCSHLINLCTYSKYSSATPQCSFFSVNSLANLITSDSSGFSLKVSNSMDISMKLVSYSQTGNYLGQKTMVLGDLMICGLPTDAQFNVKFGAVLSSSCTYDFNIFLSNLKSTKYKGQVHQLLVLGDDGKYYQVGVVMPSATQKIKRFFIYDTYTDKTKLTIMKGFTLSFTFSNGAITAPILMPEYLQLSVQDSKIVSQSSIVNLNYSVSFTSDFSSYWTGVIASFIVISVLALVHAIGKTYIGYLNRKSPITFFVNFIGVYSLWLFYYLLFMTGYWYMFSKLTSSPFLVLPQPSSSFYLSFYAVVIVMVIFRLIWALFDKADKLSTQVFLINWQKGQFKNSWRQIFIINSLAQFYTYRTISLFWMLAILMFFMNGVGWEKYAAQITSTSFSTTLVPKNRLLLYFVSCAVFLAVGTVFKILRRLSVIIWPYPFQDFVDYCTVSNISFVFMKKRSPHAFYLSASLPDQTDVTFKQINDAIKRGQQKNRNIANQLHANDNLNLYTIYLSKEIQDKYTQMLKKMQDQQHAKRVKYGKDNTKKLKVNYRDQFVQTKLKPHITTMQKLRERKKSTFQYLCGTPVVDLRQQGALKHRSLAYYDENMQLVNQVFPNGNQFQDIHTLIVIFLGWVTLFNSCPIAAFLTYLVDQYLINSWISTTCRNNLQSMTKVKKGFMI